MRATVIPDELRQATTDREGAAGAAWLESLPGLVDQLLEQWSCTPAGPAFNGKVGIVVPATSPAHGEVVLKVSFPHPANVHEPDAFVTWQGSGAVRLRERDDAAFAMLLERAGPGLLADVEVDEAIASAGELTRQLAVPGPAELPRLSEQAHEWAATVRRAADRLPARTVDLASTSIRDLCHVQPETMVHGDLNYRNVLRGTREPWLAIDPKGLIGNPAFDAITLLRTRARELLGRRDIRAVLLRRLEIFAAAAGLDREHALRWAQLRAVVIAQTSWERGDPFWLRRANDLLAKLFT